MRTALFIKSYKPDFVWLKYCLRSISKFCTGYHEVVIVVPNSDLAEIQSWGLTSERVIGINEPPNGYLFQQVCKLNAHKYTDCELIQYHDSDCIFIKPTSPSDYMENGKPWMYCTPFGTLENAEMWKQCTEKALGYEVFTEKMRRHGLTYYRTSLEAMQRDYPDINNYIMRQPGRHFSEFNFMGSYVEKHEPENYIWKDTTKFEIIPERMKQFHSYSQYTAETINWIENLLK